MLWAALGAWGGKGPLWKIYANFIIANIPSAHRVFFGVATDGGHFALKTLLEEHREPYFETPPEWNYSGLGGKISFLFGSTDKIPIIESIIDHYEFDWETDFLFPFLVASEEPKKWMDQLERFMRNQVVTRQMIQQSHCFITTQYEHAIEIVSDKVTRSSLERIAGDLAAKAGRGLRVVNSEATREKTIT